MQVSLIHAEQFCRVGITPSITMINRGCVWIKFIFFVLWPLLNMLQPFFNLLVALIWQQIIFNIRFVTLVIIGLDDAGKTTMVTSLQGGMSDFMLLFHTCWLMHLAVYCKAQVTYPCDPHIVRRIAFSLCFQAQFYHSVSSQDMPCTQIQLFFLYTDPLFVDRLYKVGGSIANWT